MADLNNSTENNSIPSDAILDLSEEIDENDWDFVNAENELEQLTTHFEKGYVGNSILEDSESVLPSVVPDLSADVLALRETNNMLVARIAELEHELNYADKARAMSEERCSQLRVSNSSLAEQIHALTESSLKLKKEYEGIIDEKRTLEKNTVQLENFVEESISHSQSGYNYLCEARERVTDMTKDMVSLRNYLCGTTVGSGLISDPSVTGFKGGVLQSVMGDLNVTLSVYQELFDEITTEIRKLKTQTVLASVTKELTPTSSSPSLPRPPHVDSIHNDRDRDRDRERHREGGCSLNKVALDNFSQGDIAMFFPTQKGDYVAFNIGSPHHYLSEESKALIGHDPHFKKVYVLGRIVMKEEKLSTTINHPYNLSPGTVYYELSVESIQDLFPTNVSSMANRRKVRRDRRHENTIDYDL